MKRRHLVELEDLSWWPRTFRDAATDYLAAAIRHAKVYNQLAPRLAAASKRSGATQIIDLCSGGGGPWPDLLPALRAVGVDVPICLTDKYPNTSAMTRVTTTTPGIRFEAESVSATDVPTGLAGFRTMFTAFHHFRPADARAILAAAVRDRQGILIAEAGSRCPALLAMQALVPLGVLVLTPGIRPFQWSRLFWTYVVPVLPLAILFDGVVSCLRVYTPDEMLAMGRQVGGDGYEWTAGFDLAAWSPLPVPYLIGVPREGGPKPPPEQGHSIESSTPPHDWQEPTFSTFQSTGNRMLRFRLTSGDEAEAIMPNSNKPPACRTDARKIFGHSVTFWTRFQYRKRPVAGRRAVPSFRSRFAFDQRMLGRMADVTQILAAIEAGNTRAAEELLPLVYEEMQKLAAAQMAREKPGQTIQATALVHEAYLRLVGGEPHSPWNSRGHFLAAAAEAMRRILVENARRKKTEKHGGTRNRIDLSQAEPLDQADPDALLDLDELLTKLAVEDPEAAGVAKLRIFAGLSVEDAAQALSTSRASAYRHWTYARAWLHARLGTAADSS